MAPCPMAVEIEGICIITVSKLPLPGFAVAVITNYEAGETSPGRAVEMRGHWISQSKRVSLLGFRGNVEMEEQFRRILL